MCVSHGLVDFGMSTTSDMDQLFDLYVLLQDLMKKHLIINEAVKELALSEPQLRDFETIELACMSILEGCDAIEKCIRPKGCCCHI